MLLLVIVLFPLTIYTLVIGLINRRRTPLLVPGTWDFAGLLFAVSGFLLAGGAFALGSFSIRWRLFWLFGQSWLLRDMEDSSYLFIVALVGCYLLLVAGGSAVLLRRRRQMTIVYNVRPAVFEELFAQVLESKNLAWKRLGNRLFLTPPDVPLPGQDEHSVVVLDIDGSSFMHTVTLQWGLGNDHREQGVREEVETEVARILPEMPTGKNPVAGWILMVGALLSGVTFFLLVLLIVAAAAEGPR